MLRFKAMATMVMLAMLSGVPVRAAQSSPLGAALSRESVEFFERHIRPVLADRCYECHSTQSKKVKGGLVLDSRDGLTRGGDSGPAIVPGNPEKSRLIQALKYQDVDLQMPPKDRLPPEQISAFEDWVRMGAPDPRTEVLARGKRGMTMEEAARFWAFQPISHPLPPKVKDRKWSRNPIDAFILADLEERKFRPAPAADKRTLLRRATFDLTGLPPTAGEIESFLKDQSPEAFGRVVDRLLASPRFGERWGRHWLDVARYADSNGLENNVAYPNAWRYRDYVVAAFNDDKPYDQFIREQLAGDLLPVETDEARYQNLTATGFLLLGPKMLFEPNREKLLMDVADEQIDVTSKAFLALTVSCARCHDHKFDPIPTRDYYSLAGIFKSTETLGASDSPDSRGMPRWMERPLASATQALEYESYQAKVRQVEEEYSRVRMERTEFPGDINSGKLAGIVVDNLAAEITGSWKESFYSTNFVDKNYLQDGNAEKGRKSVRFRPNLPKDGPYEVLVAYVARGDRARNVPVTIACSEGERKVTVDQSKPAPVGKVFTSIGTFQFKAGTNGSVTISNEGTRGFVIADAVQFIPVTEPKMEMMAMTGATPSSNRPPTMLMAMEKTPESADLDQIRIRLDEMRSKSPPPLPTVMAVKDGQGVNCRINLRGDPEKLGDEAPRGFLTVFTGREARPALADLPQSGRLELANWIASSNHPLTARVAVNRYWYQLFGRGLVESVDNFGSMGETPSHPELLDYLARYYFENGWSTKKVLRLMLLSSAYQMSSEVDATAHARDPDNRLFWRMNRRRLDAEAIRDSILAVSGKLDLRTGGSLLDTNRVGLNLQASDGEQVASNRRSVFLPVIRNNISDMFQVFDFAEPHVPSGRRFTTTAPTQALFLMNSPFLMEQSRAWSEALSSPAVRSDSERVAEAFVRAFSRPPRPAELEGSLRFLKRFQQDAVGREPDAERRSALAWQAFCQALLASTEFSFLN